MQTNEKQLNDLMKSALRNQLSSEQQEDARSTYQQPASRSGFRKPIKNPFSDHSESSDSEIQQPNNKSTVSPFPPKQPKPKSVLQQAQQTMKWNREEQAQIDILSKLQGQGMKDKKIQQLAKKYKSLNIAYERQKTLRTKLQQQLNSQLKINEDTRNKSVEKENTIRTLDKSQVKDGKCNNPGCSQNQKKIMEFRLVSQNLKTELNKAHRLIAREIGESFNIDQALNEQNAWKGRQQKIQKLKGRIKQLQQKLTNNGVNVSHMSGFTQMSSATKTNKDFSMSRTSTMAENKRKQFDNLKIQVDALKSENELLQGKVKALNSRKINLQGQIKEIRSEYEKKKQIFIEKSQNDDKFISLLKNQNQKLKKQQRVVTKIVYKDEKSNEQVNNLRRQIQKLRVQLKKATEQKAQQREQKCIDNRTQQQDERIQIKFPPAPQKKRSVERPNSSKQTQPHHIIKNSQSISSKSPTDREVSTQKKRQLQNQYIKNNKYLKKLTPEQEINIYQNWKSGKKI